MVETIFSTASVNPGHLPLKISSNATIVASKELLCCDLSDGAVILDLQSGVYYGLDPVGTFIWGLIQEPKSLAEITAAVLKDYDVDADRCAQDLQQLFTEMTGLKLIEVKDDASV